MKPEVSLPYSQKSIIEPYSGPGEYNTCWVLPRNLVISGFPTKTVYVFLFSLMQAARSYKTYKRILCYSLELLSDNLSFNKESLTFKGLM